jgi:drug/metabolite transporter (DMT)-like permease
MTPMTWAMLVLLSLCWGASFFFIGVAVKELPTFTIVVARVGLAALVLWMVVLASGAVVPQTRTYWRSVTFMGLANCVLPFVLIVWGQSHVPSSLAAIFIATTPLFGIVIAHVRTADEPLTLPNVASVLFGFAGVVVLIGPGMLHGIGTHLIAQLAILGGAFFYALSSVYARRFSRDGISPLLTATGQLTVSTVMLLPFALLLDRPWTLAEPSTAVIAAVISNALISTAFAYMLYFRIVATAGANNLMLVNYLVPVGAVILGVAFLHETLGPQHFAGAALIFAGLALRDGKVLTLIRRAAGQEG